MKAPSEEIYVNCQINAKNNAESEGYIQWVISNNAIS